MVFEARKHSIAWLELWGALRIMGEKNSDDQYKHGILLYVTQYPNKYYHRLS